MGAAFLEQVTPLVDEAEAVFFQPEGHDFVPRGAVQRNGPDPVTAFHFESGHLGLLDVVVAGATGAVGVVGVPWQIHLPAEQALRVPDVQMRSGLGALLQSSTTTGGRSAPPLAGQTVFADPFPWDMNSERLERQLG